VNQYRYVIDQDLVKRWEEFLSYWRPLLAQPRETHIFLNSAGRPFNEQTINWAIRSATWRFTGKIMHPHLIRDCYASDMLAHGASVHDVARDLNDTIQTVHHRYAHIIDTGADQRPLLSSSSTRQHPRPGILVQVLQVRNRPSQMPCRRHSAQGRNHLPAEHLGIFQGHPWYR
jgi:site-specific recombinase XerD